MAWVRERGGELGAEQLREGLWKPPQEDEEERGSPRDLGDPERAPGTLRLRHGRG